MPLIHNRGSEGKEETGGRRFNLKGSHTASQAQKLKLMREQVPLTHSPITINYQQPNLQNSSWSFHLTVDL